MIILIGYFIGGLILILITGLIRVIVWINELKSEIEFINDYHQRFVQIANAFNQRQSLDSNLYHWLISNSIQAQNILGQLGRIYYLGSYHQYNIPNYQAILNTIPNIRTGLVDTNDLAMCDDMLIRFLGHRRTDHQNSLKSLANPFTWFQYGMQFYVGLPLRLLYWFGIIGSSTFNRATSNQFFKIISGIVSLTAFLAALVTVVLGWEKSMEILQKVF